jgi:hypothetical protein
VLSAVTGSTGEPADEASAVSMGLLIGCLFPRCLRNLRARRAPRGIDRGTRSARKRCACDAGDANTLRVLRDAPWLPAVTAAGTFDAPCCPGEAVMLQTDAWELSSSDARDEILAQHGELRNLLAEVAAIAERAAATGEELEALRHGARALYEALAAHMAFEDQVLPAALRDVLGWGAVIRQRMEADHARQRESLARAISAIGPDGLGGAALIEDVRAFVATLVVDMETEERGLLEADLDALAADSRGG